MTRVASSMTVISMADAERQFDEIIERLDAGEVFGITRIPDGPVVCIFEGIASDSTSTAP